MARLQLAGLSVCGAGGRAPLLHGLDLDIADGELLAVVGTGRSALLRALIGLADVAAGELYIDGEPATDWAPAERDMAMVFADHAPYPHLRVRDNLALPLRLAGLPAAEIARRVTEVAAELQLTVHLDRWPGQLSGSQRQRLAIGRVLVRARPAAYLLDEPLSVPDPQLRPRLRGLVRGVTTVWTCADPAEAASIGDRVAILAGGRLAQVGTPAALSARPATLDVALLAPLNLLPGTAEDGSVRTPLGVLPIAADRHEVLVGIRPADLAEGGDGIRFTLLAGPDGTLRHPALTRAAANDPRLSSQLLTAADPAGRRTVAVTLDPGRALLFDPETGAALRTGPPGSPA